LGGVNPGLVGRLVFLTPFGEIFLERLQLGSLLGGEHQLLLNTSRKEALFAQRLVIFQPCLAFLGLDSGERIGVGVLRQQCGRKQHQ
jgi:hypothetical protein